jgi:hypothetical protein
MKRHRTYSPPPGALEPLRNVRLYGGRDEQAAGTALRSRGTPSPDRAYVPSRSRASLRQEAETSEHLRHLQAAQSAMLEAQRAVRAAREHGHDYVDLAARARSARARYLSLSGGLERRDVSVDQGSETSPVRAV